MTTIEIPRSLNPEEYRRLLECCKALPRPKGNYLVKDYVQNMILTVLDYMMWNKAVVRAHDHFVSTHGQTIGTHQQLKEALSRFSDTKEGNTDAGIFLWNYRLWTRAHQLRMLLDYFESLGVTTQADLERWAYESDFARDFQGKVPRLGFAVYKWLLIRQGVETIKPDVHVRRFVEAAVGRRMTDIELVEALEAVAKDLAIKAYELDWSIWEYQRSNN